MKIFKVNECLVLTKPIVGEVIGEHRDISLPIGTVATVVLVHGNPDHPKAYEIEAHIQEQNCYVLATLESGNVGSSK
jgi:hypothetical protein